jgi:hypothetical protein
VLPAVDCGLRVPRRALWQQAFEAELLTFSAGKHDDQVDALGLVGQLLDQMVKGTALKPARREPEDSWTQLFDRDRDGDVRCWRVA